MSLHLKNIFRRIEADATRLLNQDTLNTHEILVTWRELGAGAAPQNPLFASHNTPTDFVERSDSFKAFVYDLENAAVRSHFHKEFQSGDIIIDYPASKGSFADKQEVRFLYKGSHYVPKQVGDKVAESWDASQGNVGMRTLLLTIHSKAPV